MKIKTLIIDDSSSDLEKIAVALTGATSEFGVSFDIELTDSFSGIDEYMNYDLYILDIDMPDVNGFDLASQIQNKKPDAVVLFCSWHEECIVDSFKLNTFYFIRKSKLEKDMKDAIHKLTNRFRKIYYVYNYKGMTEYISIMDIVFVESLKNYISIVTVSKKEYVERKPMQVLKAEIPMSFFVSISAGCIVNINYIYSISNTSVILTNGKTISIPSLRVSQVRKEYLAKKVRYVII